MASGEPKKTCFVIAPIGEERSDIRVRSDNILKFIIEPTTFDCGYTAIRSDKISEPGIITNQIIQHLLEDDLVIADLTDGSPNVFYELAVRHFIGKPYVQIAQSQGPLPFDVAPARTILFLDTNSSNVDSCRLELARQIKATEQNPGYVESPISLGIDILQLRRSNNLAEKSNAEILSMLQDLRGEFVKALRSQSERMSELQSSLLAIENRNDSKDQFSSNVIVPSIESSFSKEMDWDNFIAHLSLFDRTNLAELLDDFLNNPYKPKIYIPDATHLLSIPYSGFFINTTPNGDYEIKFYLNTIVIKKEDLKTFRDRVAGRGIYSTSRMGWGRGFTV